MHRTTHLGVGAVLLGFALGCRDRAVTGPGYVGPLAWPLPADLTGKIALITDIRTSAEDTWTQIHVIDVAGPVDNIVRGYRRDSNGFPWAPPFQDLTWAPDGRHVVLAFGAFDGQLRSIDVATGEETGIPASASVEYPAYSADGQLAWWQAVGDTSWLRIDGRPVYVASGTRCGHLSWSPSSDALIFNCPPYGALQRISLADSTVTQVLAPESGEGIWHPEYSPDGSRIAFVRTSGATQTETIWTIAANGEDSRQITAGREPHWTPGGAYLAFLRDNGVYLISPGGGTPVRVIGLLRNAGIAMTWSR
jgi:hypothetical protein